MIRKYFPRGEDGSVKYAPPFTEDGGPGAENGATYAYPLEYVNLVGEYIMLVICYDDTKIVFVWNIILTRLLLF